MTFQHNFLPKTEIENLRRINTCGSLFHFNTLTSVTSYLLSLRKKSFLWKERISFQGNKLFPLKRDPYWHGRQIKLRKLLPSNRVYFWRWMDVLFSGLNMFSLYLELFFSDGEERWWWYVCKWGGGVWILSSLIMTYQDYFIHFRPSQFGMQANLSSYAKPDDYQHAENSLCWGISGLRNLQAPFWYQGR